MTGTTVAAASWNSTTVSGTQTGYRARLRLAHHILRQYIISRTGLPPASGTGRHVDEAP